MNDVGCLVLAVLLTVMIFLGALIFLNKTECDNLQRLSPEYEFNFALVGGCRVRLENGYWADIDDVRLSLPMRRSND